MMIYEDEEELEPKARYPDKYKLSKATSRRAELLERTLQFLGPYKGKPRNAKIFAIRTSHLSIDDLDYMLSASRAWQKNPQALYFKMLKESTPK